MNISDIDNPFCPIPGDSLFINAENKVDIEKVVEKIKYYTNYSFNENQHKKLHGSVSGGALYAAYDALKDLSGLGSRIMLLAANGCFMGYGSCKQFKSYNPTLNINKEDRNLYEPQVTKLYKS